MTRSYVRVAYNLRPVWDISRDFSGSKLTNRACYTKHELLESLLCMQTKLDSDGCGKGQYTCFGKIRSIEK